MQPNVGSAASLTGVVLALVFTMIASANAQDQATTNLLETADTSSPQGVLRTFVNDGDMVIEEWLTDSTLSFEGGLVFTRVLATMDFTATPDGDALTTQIRRFALLKEVLARVDLPPIDTVPDAESVESAGLTRWVVPGTSVAIAIRDSGPRAGEWAFSAGTVARLDRLYGVARRMPYKPGAFEGFYDLVDARAPFIAQERLVRNRLKPIDTSSPRATIQQFLSSINRAHAIVMEADAGLRADPPTLTIDEARLMEETAHNLLNRATSAMDLSDVPPARRADVGIEAALQIKEIVDRLPPIPIGTVPDARSLADLRRAGTGPVRFRLPNTPLDIVEILDGPRAGEFLFSRRSVEGAQAAYEQVADLGYRFRDAGYIAPLAFLDPTTTEGFYQYYTSSPGFLIPLVSGLGRFIEGLPPAMHSVVNGQTTWQWVGLAASIVIAVLLSALAYWLVKRLQKTLASPLDRWARLAAPAAIAAIAGAAEEVIDTTVNITGTTLGIVTTAAGTVVVITAAWAVFILSKAVAESIVVARGSHMEPIDASLARIAGRLLGFLGAAWIVVRGAQNLGADILPLLAGLGVGGLAVALAAQKTLANFIGSLILFANKPVREGDFCQFGDQTGIVEKIGLHSTRIRTLERSIISVPNSDFSEMQINNLALRDERRFRTVLQLRYETTPEQMRYILVKLRELLLGHPMVSPDPARVRFVAFGAYSKDVEIVAYIRTNVHDKYLAACEDVLLRMEDVILKAGSGFAFPSQTAYLARDTGVDKTNQTVAETNVQRWRALDKLPFPDFPDEDRDRLEDILDYPPKGSPGAEKA